jgi:polyisoprenoid-binding protein YceI
VRTHHVNADQKGIIMRARFFTTLTLGGALAAALAIVAAPAAQSRALGLDTAKITIDGTSNVHAWTASTTTVRVTRVQLADGVAGPAFWDAIVKPGALTAFEIAIPAATLKSAKSDLDKNMHKALNVKDHADITFRLVRLEKGAALRAVGMLKIAGVEKEVAFDLRTERRDSSLLVSGAVELLMTDFGIVPPKAMLGMLRTDPKVKVTFETMLAVPLT